MKRFFVVFLALVALPWFSFASDTPLEGFGPDGYCYVTYGQYPQGANGESHPILWRVLRVEDQAALLLSEYVLDVHSIQDDANSFTGWESCDLREWLESTFTPAAFAEQEQASLLPDAGGDRVSLPEAELLKDAALGFAQDRDRVAEGTPYAQTQGLKRHTAREAGYWLRTRSSSNLYAQRMIISGGRMGYLKVSSPGIGVRPTVTLAMDMLVISGGTGTKSAPYILASSPEAVEQALKEREAAEAAACAAEEARKLALEQQIAQEAAALGAAQQALADALAALKAAQDAGQTGDALKALEAHVDEAQQALNRLTLRERAGFPMLTAAGFLPEGEPEFVFEDPENGIWRYANSDLLIEITRTSIEGPIRYLAAEVFVRDGTSGFRMVPHDRDHMLIDAKRYVEKPAVIARNNDLVFTIDGDYFLYRIGRRRTLKTFAVGVVIRGGEILENSPPVASRNTYPPLDMLALFADGDMRAYKARERTAQELLEEGAVDVLSFGPYLIRDGEINTSYSTYGTSKQPRAAIGMVEKGHYWCLIVEGRIGESRGMTTRQVGDLMAELGCDMAFNLDGGWTSAMVFMGKQLNQLDKTGVRDNARPQNEVMGIGHTDAFR